MHFNQHILIKFHLVARLDRSVKMDSYPSSSSSSSFESSPLSAVQNVASGICNFVSTSVNGKPLEGEPSKVLWHSLEEYEVPHATKV